MFWDADEFNKKLSRATATFDRVAAAALCDGLIEYLLETDADYLPAKAAVTLQILRNKRMFTLMRKVGDAFLQTGRDSLKLRRLYAQALIDEGELTAALAVLGELLTLSANDPAEKSEACGLIARVHKQIYMNSVGRHGTYRNEHLRRAIETYYKGYESAPADRLWHGINSVALLARAVRDGVPCEGFPEPREIARRILCAIEEKNENKNASTWDFGTALEACIAIEEVEAALEWLGRYVTAPYTDAFELGSTERQLTEVWQLDSQSGLGRVILPTLRAQLLLREGGHVELTPQDLQAAPLKVEESAYEKVFGADSYKTLKWYQNGLARAHLVARIGRNAEQGHGTGFLLKGSDLAPHFGDDSVLITNAHVVSDDPAVRAKHKALAPQDAIITFEAHGPEEYQVAQLLWSSPPEVLDATILRLTRPDRLASKFTGDLPVIAKTLPLVEDAARVYVIGHPKGAGLSFSLQDNGLLDHESPFIHYRAPTEGGSSGSPVFNANWQLIGLHHAGREDMPRLNKKPGTYPANEGLWLRAIIAAISKTPPVSLPAPPVGV